MRYIIKLLSRWFAFLILFFYWSGFSLSQGYLVDHYTEMDGLPTANVHDLVQDHQGKLWFATRGGIAAYDGVSWEKYTLEDGLPVLSFHRITVDQQGRIWALSHIISEGFILVYRENPGGNDRAPWHRVKGYAVRNNQEKPMVITSFQLVEPKQQPGTEQPIIAAATANRGIFLWYRGRWQNLTEDNGLLSNSVNGLASTAGKLYAATNKGLSIIDIHTTNKRHRWLDIDVDNRFNQLANLPPGEIKGIAIQFKDKYPDTHLKYSRVWLYSHQWLGYFEENRLNMTLYPVEIPLIERQSLVHLLPDYRCGVFVSNWVSINYFNYTRHSWEPLLLKSGLISSGANSMSIDFEKNIWISCNQGVNKISSRRFRNFHMIDGLLEDEVSAVLEFEPGKFVFGHNSGITLYDEKTNAFKKIPLPPKKSSERIYRVLDLQMDPGGNIWVAMGWAGLGKFNPRTIHYSHQVTWYGKIHGLPGDILCMWIDKNTGNMWVGTEEGIFFRKHTDAEHEHREKFQLMNFGKSPPPIARKINGSSGKLRYIGTFNKGIYVYEENNRKSEWKNYRVPGDNNANNIYAIKKDSSGRLLVGTLSGLLVLENETLKKFKHNGFEVNRPVYFIVEDQKHRLWIGTNYGVVRWDGKNKRTYTTREGLSGLETNRAAGIIDSKRRIWIGTNQGVSCYEEEFDENEGFQPPPKIRLLTLETPEKQIPLTGNQPIRLAYNQDNIGFQFSGISFVNEKALRFKHRLQGFEKQWSKEQSQQNRMIRYTNLPPGTYYFHLQGQNALGVWSGVVTSPGIIILKPFYKTWWFYLSVVLAAAVLFYIISRFLSEKRHAALLEKQVEERTHQLQTVEKRYQDLFQDSKDVVFFTDTAGKLVDINPAGVELFGYSSKEEMLNTSSIRAFLNSLRDLAALRHKIESQGYVKDYEFILTSKDGEPITSLVTASLVKTPAGKIVGYRGIVRDITQQKKLEQQLIQAQKMEAIGTLAGGIAHDFNNILGAILGYTELVLDDAPRGTLMQENAQRILNATHRAAELVKQILAFSRQSKQEQKPLILADIVKEALKLFRSTLPATIDIRQNIDAVSGVILGDSTQIHQVMMNLCANAAHAMKDTGGILEIGLDEVILDAESLSGKYNLKPGTYLRLMVSDTGYGIPQAVMKRIFEPYFTTKKIGEGTGMGLAVIHGIVKNHKGDISVYSEPGKGTSFHLFFPKIQGKIEPDSKRNQKVPGGSERILLVDDEITLTEMGTQILERLGYEVKGISNPIAALEIFRQEPDRFQLVISDLTMPQMTGIQFAEEIKKIKPHIPIILCSGYSASLSGQQIDALGISDFIMKPIIKSELAQVVRRVLDK